jgi:iron complex outermembrane receptor protein
VIGATEQDRVSGGEVPTAGYIQVKLFASWSFASGATSSTVTARLDNATDALYRNHLSLIKELVPEVGRNFKLLYQVRF